ncbi:MAG: hypothetical protein IPJ65_07660 [Archangiaceae bacterium]|nr:hypothetical protein [Archangiaceae bacterium]
MKNSSTVSAERFARFAPNRADAERLGLEGGQVTVRDLEAAQARVETHGDEFADPSALLSYVQSQRALLAAPATARAAPPATDDRVIVDDIVPRPQRTKASVAVAATDRAMLERLGLTPEEVARAEKLNVSPHALAYLLVEPVADRSVSVNDPVPHNTADDVLTALEQGLPLSVMAPLHRKLIAVAEMAGLRKAGVPTAEYRRFRECVGPEVALELWAAGIEDIWAYRAAARLEAPLRDLAKAKKAGVGAFPLALALEHMNLDEAIRLHQHNPTVWSTSLYALFTADELELLCKSGVVPSSGPLVETERVLRSFLDAGVPPNDIAWLEPAGGSGYGAEQVKRRGGSIDDYLKLSRCGWRADCSLDSLDHWAIDDVVTFVEAFASMRKARGETIDAGAMRVAFSRADGYAKQGLSVAQAVALAADGVDARDFDTYYLSAGLSIDAALRAIAAGG